MVLILLFRARPRLIKQGLSEECYLLIWLLVLLFCLSMSVTATMGTEIIAAAERMPEPTDLTDMFGGWG